MILLVPLGFVLWNHQYSSTAEYAAIFLVLLCLYPTPDRSLWFAEVFLVKITAGFVSAGDVMIWV